MEFGNLEIFHVDCGEKEREGGKINIGLGWVAWVGRKRGCLPVMMAVLPSREGMQDGGRSREVMADGYGAGD